MSLIVLCEEVFVFGTSSNKRRGRITLDTEASQTAIFGPALTAVYAPQRLEACCSGRLSVALTDR
jgi:hypothetical protein